MLYFLIGLAAFLGVHSVRIVAPQWRQARVEALGLMRWKAFYSLVSIAAFVLMIWGYGQARAAPSLLWVPPVGMRHLAALLILPAVILLVASLVPGNHFKAKLGHPMLLSIKLWALAHLLVSGWLHSMLLFGAFLIWAIVDFRSARRRPGGALGGKPPGLINTLIVIVIGAAAWAGFALHGHRWLIGVAPFPGLGMPG